MSDVAIIGVGLHPFGRFEGKTAMEMAVDAIQLAVADAGVEWKDIQAATGAVDGGQPGRDRRHGGAFGHSVHQRVQCLRDRGQCRQGVRRRNPAR